MNAADSGRLEIFLVDPQGIEVLDKHRLNPVWTPHKLLEKLARHARGETIVRNTCEARVGKNRGSTFQMTTTPNPAQHRALQLLQAISV